ncbi:MAG: copper amine oxidase, partial [Clostridiales bacterium]|nr:copper amine oxidase [Clostridiales bacterium]
DMIDRSFFNHVDPNGQDFRYRINTAGYQFAICAENIAKNCPGAIIAHEAYMNSQNHRNNILGSTERIGIGVRMCEETILQTELFITYK